MIVAAPGATAVTSPVALTVASAVLLLPHVTTRPVSGAPVESLGVAVSCTVRPACTVATAGVTVTVFTGTGATATFAEPVFPPAAAVMVTWPMPTPVTFPFPSTVANAGLPVDHATDIPETDRPLASSGSAASCWLVPT